MECTAVLKYAGEARKAGEAGDGSGWEQRVRRRLGEDGGEMKAGNIEIFQTISKLCKTSRQDFSFGPAVF